AEHLRAAVSGIGLERIVQRAGDKPVKRFAADRIPAPDHAIGAAGQKRFVVGEELDRPDRQAGPDQGALTLAAHAIDHRHRAAYASRSDQPAVGRYRDGNDRSLGSFDLTANLALRRKKIDFAVGTGSDDLAVRRN